MESVFDAALGSVGVRGGHGEFVAGVAGETAPVTVDLK